MSDEYLNNEEETSALFVSAKKKKQAEEEAARKAAEEQARREAAEAEVRRMEAEVEERKRKAEEERKALEEQEKQLAEDKLTASVETKKEPKAKKESSGSALPKSKLPIFIGIGAVAVVAIVLILVFALKGKGGSGSFDPATTEFNAEYVSKEEGFDVKFAYPDTVFKEVTEEKKDDSEVTVHFGTENGIDVVMDTYKTEDGKETTKANTIAFVPANKIQQDLTKKSTDKIKELIPDAKISDEVSTDVAADDANKFLYKCTYESAQEGNGGFVSWIDAAGNGKCVTVMANVKGGKTPEETVAVRDAFADKNIANALAVPGNNPPTATDTDGKLEIDEIHMGLIVPKDVFKKYDKGEIEYYLYSDDNGASILVDPVDAGGEIAESFTVDGAQELLKKWVDRGVNDYFKAVDSRMVLDENFVAEETGLYYDVNAKDTIGGVTYWERYRAGYWYDERQQKDFFYILITMAPEKNKDVYKPIFDKMLDRMVDL